MKIEISKSDDQYKLIIYNSGVQYVVRNSSSWLVDNPLDEIGSRLKAKHFPEPTLEQSIKQWFSKERLVSTLGRNDWNVKLIAIQLGVTTRKIYAVLRKSDWCDAQEGYTSTRYGDCKKYYTYRYNG